MIVIDDIFKLLEDETGKVFLENYFVGMDNTAFSSITGVKDEHLLNVLYDSKGDIEQLYNYLNNTYIDIDETTTVDEVKIFVSNIIKIYNLE